MLFDLGYCGKPACQTFFVADDPTVRLMSLFNETFYAVSVDNLPAGRQIGCGKNGLFGFVSDFHAGNVVCRPSPKYKAFQHGVGSKPVRSVHAVMCGLAAGIEPEYGRSCRSNLSKFRPSYNVVPDRPECIVWKY
jgi:hypothetical protein